MPKFQAHEPIGDVTPKPGTPQWMKEVPAEYLNDNSGATSAWGNIMLREGLDAEEMVRTFLHELGHRHLLPGPNSIARR